MKRATASLLVSLLVLGGHFPLARADDTDVFTTAVVPPNVLILLDNSGSMRDIPPVGPVYRPSTTYAGAYVTNDVYIRDGSTACTADNGKDIGNITAITGTRITSTARSNLLSSGTTRARVSSPLACGGVNATLMLGNYRNYLETFDPGSKTKMEIARDAVISLVNTTSGVRFGMLNYGSTLGATSEGGTITIPISDMTPANKTNFVNTVTSVAQRVLDGQGTWTPLGESLQEGVAYYAGGPSIYNSGVTYTSPIQNECQKNFVVVVTDGMPTQDRNTRLTSPYNGNFRLGLGNYIGDAKDNITSPPAEWLAPTPGIDPTFTLTAYTNDNASFMLRDVAKFLFDADLRPDLAGKQNVVTYTVGFGVDHPFLRAVADVGGGLYFSVNNEQELSDALKTALTDIISRGYSFTSLVVPAVQTTADNTLYSASFEPTSARPFWKGFLKAFPLDANGNPPLAPDPFNPARSILDDTRRLWEGGERLNSPTAPARNAFTTDGAGGRILFTTPPLASTDLGVTVTDAAPLIDYTRGDHGAAVDWVLGDIFHSTPVVVGVPPLSSADPSFQEFRRRLQGRPRLILAGANDGMLHAFFGGTTGTTMSFNGGTFNPGDEVWAFIPRDDLMRLQQADPGITPTAVHQYFVDSTARVGDVWVDADGDFAKKADGTEWLTVAVAGQRKGGRSYFALDITDPGAPAYPRPMWRFEDALDTGTPASPPAGNTLTDATKAWTPGAWAGFALIDSTGKRFLITGNTANSLTVAGAVTPAAGTYRISQLGESWSEAAFGQVRINIAGIEQDRYVAFVAGGYDDLGDPTAGSYSGTSRIGAALYLVDVGTGQVLHRFSGAPNPNLAAFPKWRTVGGMIYAMPSSPLKVDLDLDGYVDRVYVGDLKGQLWRFTLSQKNPDGTWNSTTLDPNNWTAGLVFDASAARTATAARPIFYPPTAAFDDQNRLWLFFGTGNQNSPQDLTAGAAPQAAFFAVIDPGTGLGSLQWSLGYGAPDNTFAVGEKVLAASAVFFGSVFLTTYTPTTAVCAGGGTGKLYALQFTNGNFAALDFSTMGFSASDLSAPDATGKYRAVVIGTGVPSRPVISQRQGGGVTEAELFVSSSGRDILRQPNTGGILRVPGPSALNVIRYWREL